MSIRPAYQHRRIGDSKILRTLDDVLAFLYRIMLTTKLVDALSKRLRPPPQ
jgi:hypothetical protein